MPRVNYDVGHPGAQLVAADFNNDGILDLAVAGYSYNVVSILLGDGHGGFHKPYQIAAAEAPHGLAVGDFNHDGNMDIAVANDGGSVSVFLGKGNGHFDRRQDYTTGTESVSVVAGDFDGDGELDLAVANLGAKTISLLHGKGNGTFGNKQDFRLGKYNDPWQIVAGDFNGDGRLDLAAATSPCDCITVLLNSGDSHLFLKPKRYDAGVSESRSLVTADFNGDGKLDIATAGFNGSTVSLLLGNGKGGFGKSMTIETGDAPVSIAAGDFNGDGAMDLTTANWDDYTMGVLLQ